MQGIALTDNSSNPAATSSSTSVVAGTSYGLESLRAHEGLAQPHAPGAITNPRAPQYADPTRFADPARKFPGGASFGNPTRKFVA